MPSLAIIICTWNRAESLQATLLSLRGQQAAPGVAVEVVVVDNNSSDATRATVEALVPSWPLGTLKYAFEGRQGKQFALNTGIAASTGEVLAFTDDDILFPPGWVAGISATFADGKVDLAGGKTVLTWPPSGIPAWYADSMAAVLGGIDLGEHYLDAPPRGYAPAGANLIATRALFERVGPYSEIHFRHMDYEFGLRCAHARCAIAYDPALVVLAPVDPQILSKRYFRRWSFKAGISRDDAAPSQAATLFGVPRWVYRQLIGDLLALPRDLLFGTPSQAFARELHIWRSWGTIASAWYLRLWPEKYPQWVARYSQKKKNLY